MVCFITWATFPGRNRHVGVNHRSLVPDTTCLGGRVIFFSIGTPFLNLELARVFNMVSTRATELSVDRPGFLAKRALLFRLQAVTYPR